VRSTQLQEQAQPFVAAKVGRMLRSEDLVRGGTWFVSGYTYSWGNVMSSRAADLLTNVKTPAEWRLQHLNVQNLAVGVGL
jgi:hypothetical protein